ncbi:HEAT repeat domain-containing protein [Actinocorallia sp. A-T 12471]|uniref:HEAT repeat domain-containing protein n=1 Tax=Actinocorallia sp. A-T 12471 TaxID=3089813 RepID=UPI0029D31994|nr:HEAT repeat domain-containing protein [Actinocorallia sp. A-T 12471]MDX6741413.1 HEAT repeat domain-containing protein [Actinocorallia sp. A-T 12471]
MDGVLARLRAKLAGAAARPGGPGHLNAALPEADVAAFEAEHGVRLPAAYRAFVTGFGDGGAGPDLGVLPLRRAWAEVVADLDGHLAKPSPFVPGRRYDDEWCEEFLEREGDDAEYYRGALAVNHGGGGIYTLLVVTGPARGRLVRVDAAEHSAPRVLEDADFLAWYERWLDELLAGYDLRYFALKLPGGEAEFLAAAGDPDAAVRRQAVLSFSAPPELSASARRAVAEAVGDADAAVRRTALYTARYQRIGEAEAAARDALADADPGVREAALGALAALAVPDAAALARAALRDTSRDVVARAVWTLQDLADYTADDAAPLLSSDDPKIRITGAWSLHKARGAGVADLIAAAFADPVPEVRSGAVHSAERLRLPELRPAIAALLATETDVLVRNSLLRWQEKDPG